MPDNINDTRQEAPLKPTVLDAEDIGRMVPFLGRHPRLLNRRSEEHTSELQSPS